MDVQLPDNSGEQAHLMGETGGNEPSQEDLDKAIAAYRAKHSNDPAPSKSSEIRPSEEDYTDPLQLEAEKIAKQMLQPSHNRFPALVEAIKTMRRRGIPAHTGPLSYPDGYKPEHYKKSGGKAGADLRPGKSVEDYSKNPPVLTGIIETLSDGQDGVRWNKVFGVDRQEQPELDPDYVTRHEIMKRATGANFDGKGWGGYNYNLKDSKININDYPELKDIADKLADRQDYLGSDKVSVLIEAFEDSADEYPDVYAKYRKLLDGFISKLAQAKPELIKAVGSSDPVEVVRFIFDPEKNIAGADTIAEQLYLKFSDFVKPRQEPRFNLPIEQLATEWSQQDPAVDYDTALSELKRKTKRAEKFRDRFNAELGKNNPDTMYPAKYGPDPSEGVKRHGYKLNPDFDPSQPVSKTNKKVLTGEEVNEGDPVLSPEGNPVMFPKNPKEQRYQNPEADYFQSKADPSLNHLMQDLNTSLVSEFGLKGTWSSVDALDEGDESGHFSYTIPLSGSQLATGNDKKALQAEAEKQSNGDPALYKQLLDQLQSESKTSLRIEIIVDTNNLPYGDDFDDYAANWGYSGNSKTGQRLAWEGSASDPDRASYGKKKGPARKPTASAPSGASTSPDVAMFSSWDVWQQLLSEYISDNQSKWPQWAICYISIVTGASPDLSTKEIQYGGSEIYFDVSALLDPETKKAASSEFIQHVNQFLKLYAADKGRNSRSYDPDAPGSGNGEPTGYTHHYSSDWDESHEAEFKSQLPERRQMTPDEGRKLAKRLADKYADFLEYPPDSLQDQEREHQSRLKQQIADYLEAKPAPEPYVSDEEFERKFRRSNDEELAKRNKHPKDFRKLIDKYGDEVIKEFTAYEKAVQDGDGSARLSKIAKLLTDELFKDLPEESRSSSELAKRVKSYENVKPESKASSKQKAAAKPATSVGAETFS